AAMVRAAQDRGLWNRVLHAPTAAAPTQRGMAASFGRAAGLPASRIVTVPAWPVRAAAPILRSARELAETLPQFTADLVMDSSASRALLGIEPTALHDGAARTVRWWRK